jgi:hypothetical protein
VPWIRAEGKASPRRVGARATKGDLLGNPYSGQRRIRRSRSEFLKETSNLDDLTDTGHTLNPIEETIFTVASQRSDRLSRALTLSKSWEGRRKIAHAGFERLGPRFGSPRDKLDAATDVSNLFTREAVRVFATLGLPDLIASGISDIAELAERSEVDKDALARVANHLVREG